jgi:hypothetical protein
MRSMVFALKVRDAESKLCFGPTTRTVLSHAWSIKVPTSSHRPTIFSTASLGPRGFAIRMATLFSSCSENPRTIEAA